MVFKHWDRSLDTTMPETPEAVLEIPKAVKAVIDTLD